MDELPKEARELLRLASDMHDPPSADARLRVRRGVAAALATGVGATIASQAIAQGSVKAGLFSGISAKLLGAGTAVVVVSALAVTAPKLTAPDTSFRRQAAAHADTHRAPAKPTVISVEERAVPPSEPRFEAVAVPASEPPQSVRKETHARPHARRHAPEIPIVEIDQLRSETALLNRASQAISQGDLAEAERVLEQHAAQFRRSALGEERDGLRTLVRCMQNPTRAKAQGTRFVARAPESVLAQRVMRACRIEEKP